MNKVETSDILEVVVALVELTDEQSASVVGGGLLLPAVQKVREAQPMETLSLNFEK